MNRPLTLSSSALLQIWTWREAWVWNLPLKSEPLRVPLLDVLLFSGWVGFVVISWVIWLQVHGMLLFVFWKLFYKENFMPLLGPLLGSFALCPLHPASDPELFKLTSLTCFCVCIVGVVTSPTQPVLVLGWKASGSAIPPFCFWKCRTKLHLRHHLLNSHYEQTHSGYKTLSGVKVRGSKHCVISHRKDKRPRE